MIKKILGLVATFGIALGLLWATNKYILKREQTPLEMVWMIALALIVVGIAGLIMHKGLHFEPTPKVSA